MYQERSYLSEDYLKLVNLCNLTDFNSPQKDDLGSILKSTMNIFGAESGIFCFHGPTKPIPDKALVAVANLSQKYFNQYIKHYHQLDPIMNVRPEINAGREIDVIPNPGWQNLEFYTGFIKPQKIRHMLVIYLRNKNQIAGHIRLHRYGGCTAFSNNDLL
jgi:hypothetical protein